MKLMKLKIFLGVVVVSAIAFAADDFAIGPVLVKGKGVEIRRSPWRLLYKPSNNEMSNLNLYDSARQFAEGANSMSDAAEALRDALKDPDAKPEQLQKLVDELDASIAERARETAAEGVALSL